MDSVNPTDENAQAKRCFEGAAKTFELNGDADAAAHCMPTVKDIDRMVHEAAGGKTE